VLSIVSPIVDESLSTVRRSRALGHSWDAWTRGVVAGQAWTMIFRAAISY
jgi:hypothetical protein